MVPWLLLLLLLAPGQEGRVMHDVKCDEAVIGVVMWGSDLYMVNTDDFDSCVDMCRDIDDCKSVSYLTTEYECYLKDQFSDYGEGLSLWGGYEHMDLDCPWSLKDKHELLESDIPGLIDCRKNNKNFDGANIRSFVGNSFEKCVTTCQKTEGCIAMTWGGELSKICWLKDRKDGADKATQMMGFTSLNMDCLDVGLKESCRLQDVAMPGADLIAQHADSVDACQALCEERDRCRAFTYEELDSNCWMKGKNDGDEGQVDQVGSVSMNLDCLEQSDLEPYVEREVIVVQLE